MKEQKNYYHIDAKLYIESHKPDSGGKMMQGIIQQNVAIKNNNSHTYARVDPPSCLQVLWVKLCHICAIPLEQDPDSTAWLEIAVYYLNNMGFSLVLMLSVHIHTNSPFEKTLQKIINFNSYSTAKAAQPGGKYNWALYSKTGLFKRIIRKKITGSALLLG